MNKQQQRKIAYAARNAQPGKDVLSDAIFRDLLEQSWYLSAQSVLWYAHCRSEVRTLPALRQALKGDKRIVVPYCTVDQQGDKCLSLWRLQAIDELRPGLWNILEPPAERWLEPEKQVAPQALDVVIVPGVAFDTLGGRLGNGAGYYDRLLQQVRADTVLAGVCYQSQLLPTIMMQAHDVFMDYVVTERAIYTGKRQNGR